MRAIIAFARTLGLLGGIALALVACGGSPSPAPTATVNGPALIFFYTDP